MLKEDGSNEEVVDVQASHKSSERKPPHTSVHTDSTDEDVIQVPSSETKAENEDNPDVLMADLEQRTFEFNGRAGMSIGGDKVFCDNSIVTRKYKPWICCPLLSAREQFRRFANIYFALQATLMFIGEYDVFETSVKPMTTLIPLLGTLLLTGYVHLCDDIRRDKRDKETNHREVETLTARGTRKTTKWSDVRVGNLIVLSPGDQIPADLMILCTSQSDSLCAVQTANIDGETDLKGRRAPKAMHSITSKGEDLSVESVGATIGGLTGTVCCQEPNSNICAFAGIITLNSGEQIPYTLENVLLRGSVLARCDWAIGLVVYTGLDTKVMKNNSKTPSKLSKTDKTVNVLLSVAIGVMIIMIVCTTILYAYFFNDKDNDFWYLPKPKNIMLPPVIGYIFTAIVMFNNMIPISLYVTLEVANVCHALFVNNDVQMYDPTTNTASNCKALNLCQDIGQVQYVLSDKTGTLTQNVMKFKCCSVGGEIYGVPDPNVEWTGAEMAAGLQDPARKDGLDDFLLVLTLCHTVVVAQRGDGMDMDECGGQYEADSPDEEALVRGAARVGYTFTGREGDFISLRKTTECKYVLLATNAFSSKRKCMSVVVRRPDGRKFLLVKGADDVLLAKAANSNSASVEALRKHLGGFARCGLRTLVVAMRELDDSVWKSWKAKYTQASNTITHRKKALARVAAEIEQQLTIVGGTAIEDKLQEGVPECVANLVAANIKFWVLTGDKTETAINISIHCRLLKPNTKRIRIVKDHSMTDDFNRTRGIRLLKAYTAKLTLIPSPEAESGLLEELVEVTPGDDVGLVIDGPLLMLILGEDGKDKEGCELVMGLAKHCSVLIGCRFSPAQKAHMVNMVKNMEKNIFKAAPMTLAIGDGANDVAMIQAADIGVGIAGREGMQSVMASDFSFSQFRFLQRLLFLHGHWNYVRVSRMLLYSFYKNTMFMLVQLYFCFHNGASGTLIGTSTLNGLFNAATTLPIVAFASFERDVTEEQAMTTPRLYDVGRLSHELNFGTLVFENVRAAVHSLIVWWICMAAMPALQTLGLGGTDFVGSLLWVEVILVATVRVTFMTTTWNRLSHIAWWSAFFAVMPLALLYNSGLFTAVLSDSFTAHFTFFRIFYSPTVILMILGTLSSCAAFDYFTHYIFVLVRESCFLQKNRGRSASCTSGAVVPLQNVHLHVAASHADDGGMRLDPVVAPSKMNMDAPAASTPPETKPQKCPVLSRQQLTYCRCNPVAHTLYCLFGISGTLLLTGILLLLNSQNLMQLEIQYDGDRRGADTDTYVYSPCKVPGPSDRRKWQVTGKDGGRPRPLQNNSFARCIVNMTLKQKLSKSSDANKYMVFYRLTNFYQNHLVYRNSFSQAQMEGERVPKVMFGNPHADLASECDIKPSPKGSPKEDLQERVEKSFPCGLISRSFFNDVIKLTKKCNKDGLTMDETNIAWPSNTLRLKKVDYDLEEVKNKTNYLFQRYPSIVKKDQGVTNEHFAVWFRTEFYHDFIKRYGSLNIDRDMDKGQNIAFNVRSGFEVSSFKGTKSIVIQRYSILGGDLTTMGYIFIAFGALSLVKALFVLIDTLVYKRKRRNSLENLM